MPGTRPGMTKKEALGRRFCGDERGIGRGAWQEKLRFGVSAMPGNL